MADVCEFGLVGPDDWSDDAVWIITSSFMIYTMQSGFALLTAGWVSKKNEVAVMMKVAISVVFCGFGYWLYGFGLTYGTSFVNSPFVGFGCFFVKAKSDQIMGRVYAPYLFQLSLAFASTTIMSSAIPERCKLIPFCIFSFLFPFIYSVPARWIWSQNGFLMKLGAFDLAGAGPVHLVGAVAGGVATAILRPSLTFMETKKKQQKGNQSLGSPTSAMLGFLMIWWGWLGMNCGSTFGISGKKWKYAARAAGSTINASISGGVFGLIYSYVRYKRTYKVGTLIKAMMASLVSVTAGSVVLHPWESTIIGGIGAMLAVISSSLLVHIGIDDPISVMPIHGVCALWGLLAVGLFAHGDNVLDLTQGLEGLLYSGDFTLLGVQALLALCCALWAAVTSFIFLYALNVTIGLRMCEEDELIGSNMCYHDCDIQTKHDSTFQPPVKYIPPFLTSISYRSLYFYLKNKYEDKNASQHN